MSNDSETNSKGGQDDAAWETRTVVLAPASGGEHISQAPVASKGTDEERSGRGATGKQAGAVLGGVVAGAAVVASVASAENATALPDMGDAPAETTPEGVHKVVAGAAARPEHAALAHDKARQPDDTGLAVDEESTYEAASEVADADADDDADDDADAPSDLGFAGSSEDSLDQQMGLPVEVRAASDDVARAEPDDVASAEIYVVGSAEPAVSLGSAVAAVAGHGGATEIRVIMHGDGSVDVAGTSQGDATPVRVSVERADGSSAVVVLDGEGDTEARASISSTADGTSVDLAAVGDSAQAYGTVADAAGNSADVALSVHDGAGTAQLRLDVDGVSAAVGADAADAETALGVSGELGAGVVEGYVVDGSLMGAAVVSDVDMQVSAHAEGAEGYLAGTGALADGGALPDGSADAATDSTDASDWLADNVDSASLGDAASDDEWSARVGTLATEPITPVSSVDDEGEYYDEDEDVDDELDDTVGAGGELGSLAFAVELEDGDTQSEVSHHDDDELAVATPTLGGPGAHEQELVPDQGTISFDTSDDGNFDL